jgi:hypothetical protein
MLAGRFTHPSTMLPL